MSCFFDALLFFGRNPIQIVAKADFADYWYG